MKKVTVILEKSETGYSAYLPELPGIATTGDQFVDIRKNMEEALELYIDAVREYKEELPEILKDDYQLVYKFDVQTFFEWMSKVMSQKGLCEMSDMNESLLSQYANGIKIPGPKQLKRLESALHRFADDLHAITF